ncbi:MAG: hypothetical protein V7634_860, partial [Bradyrhizobium sp.]
VRTGSGLFEGFFLITSVTFQFG